MAAELAVTRHGMKGPDQLARGRVVGPNITGRTPRFSIGHQRTTNYQVPVDDRWRSHADTPVGIVICNSFAQVDPAASAERSVRLACLSYERKQASIQ